MDVDERLRLDYEQTTELLRALVEVRFKLLAFVPAITGAGVGFFGSPRPAGELVGIGLLGLVATFGILVYELRNSQLHDAVVHRAKELERRLEFPSVVGGAGSGGLFSERPGRTIVLLGVVRVWHDRGLALVYGAALAGWAYLVAWGALSAIDLAGARELGALLGLAVGILVVVEVERADRREDKAGAPAAP